VRRTIAFRRAGEAIANLRWLSLNSGSVVNGKRPRGRPKVARLTRIQLAEALGLSLTTTSNCVAKGMPTHSVSAAKEWRTRCVRPRIKPLNERWSDGDHQVDDAESAELIWHQCDIERLNEYGLGYLVRIALACEKEDFSQARAQFEIFIPMLRKYLWFAEFEHNVEAGCPDTEESRALMSRVRTELILDMEATVCLHEDRSYRAETEGWLRKFDKILEQMESVGIEERESIKLRFLPKNVSPY
jgi:hypothetical protein